MIFLFLIDTSASMNQKFTNGFTVLDCAKNGVDHFIKMRMRDGTGRGDRYMLMTFEEFPQCIKGGWKETLGTVTDELKNLKAWETSDIGYSLRIAFEFLNTPRLQSGIDNYCQGRYPSFVEPAIVLLFTDGNQMTSSNRVLDQLLIPQSFFPGNKFTIEPFRWEQRLFSIIFKNPHQKSENESQIGMMCEVTGGKSFTVNSYGQMNQYIDAMLGINMAPNQPITQQSVYQSIKQLTIQNQVIIDFEELPRESVENRMTSTKKAIKFAPGTQIYWPIPESFWPDSSLVSLPPRTAHPCIHFSTIDSEPLLVENFPFDKYEVESCAITQNLLSRSGNISWQVFVQNSSKKEGPGFPFGYLKSNSAGTGVNLYVCPYNFPKLYPLLGEVLKNPKAVPSIKWQKEFDSYISTVPIYYIQPLKNAMKRLVPSLNLDRLDGSPPFHITEQLKKFKAQAKTESDRLAALQKQVKDQKNSLTSKQTNDNDHQKFPYGNAFDLDRNQLNACLKKMKSFFNYHYHQIHLENEAKYEVAISRMGDYQEAMMRRETLRPLDPDEFANSHPLFGNPFKKIEQKMMIDEADEARTNNSPRRKRQKLGYNFARKNSIDLETSPSPPSSPSSSSSSMDDVPSSPSSSDSESILDEEEIDNFYSNLDDPEKKTFPDFSNVSNVNNFPQQSFDSSLTVNTNSSTSRLKSLSPSDLNAVKITIIKEIRKPNTDKIVLQKIWNLNSTDLKSILPNLLYEAQRFKKKSLVEVLQESENRLLN